MSQHGRRCRRNRDQLARLPGDAAARAEPLEKSEEVRVLAVHDVRADVDLVAGVGMAPASRAPSQLARALEHQRPQAAFGKRHRAGKAGEPAADNNGVVHYASLR